MSDMVNQVKTKDGTIYDIQDARVPEILAENVGKVLAVNEAGTAFEFKDAPSGGGTKLYRHELYILKNNEYNFVYLYSTDARPITAKFPTTDADIFTSIINKVFTSSGVPFIGKTLSVNIPYNSATSMLSFTIYIDNMDYEYDSITDTVTEL